MNKFTAQDVLAHDPGLSSTELKEALDLLNVPAIPMIERWVAENDDVAHAVLHPPQHGRDGLTRAMRAANTFADERGLPTPFPPEG